MQCRSRASGSVGATFRNIKHFPIGRGKLDGMMTAIGRRAGAQIEGDVEHPAADTVYEFGFLMRLGLEVKAAHRSCRRIPRDAALDEVRIEPWAANSAGRRYGRRRRVGRAASRWRFRPRRRSVSAGISCLPSRSVRRIRAQSACIGIDLVQRQLPRHLASQGALVPVKRAVDDGFKVPG